MSLPTNILNHLPTAAAKRLRLLYAIKSMVKGTWFMFDNDLKINLLSSGFTYYEVHNHMAWLKAQGLVTVDKNTGKHYPAGTLRMHQFAQKNYQNFNTSARSFLVVKVSKEHWQDKKSWLFFIQGVKVSKISLSIRKKNMAEIGKKIRSLSRYDRQKIKLLGVAAALTEGRDECGVNLSAPPTQVSIDCIQNHFRVARSTASRWRSIAAKGGHITNTESLTPVIINRPDGSMSQLRMQWQDYLASRADIAGDDDPNRVILRDGFVYFQNANIVESTGSIVFRSIKLKAA